jgi:hypothetical protein
MSALIEAADATGSLDLDGDRLREECGVFGVFGHPDAAAITALGLHALQHRGQEAAGMVSFDGKRFHSERRMGLVGDTFSRREVIERLPGSSAIGHVRYSTTGETVLRNVQPLFAELDGGGFAIGHNGNLTNGLALRRQLVRDGALMQSTTDTEVILHLVARARRNRFIDRFIEGLRQLEGAYSFVGLTNKKLIGARDPLGIRPLVIGKLDACPILASETWARHHRREIYSRCRQRRDNRLRRRGDAFAQAFPADAAAPLHLRIHLFLAPGLDRRRASGLRGPKDHGCSARARSARGGGHHCTGTGFGSSGGDRLCPGVRHSLRAWHRPQPLRGPHLHPTEPVDPRDWGAPQAFCQSGGRSRQAHRSYR